MARLRTDCGTENGDMAAIHCSLREDHKDEFAGLLSHMQRCNVNVRGPPAAILEWALNKNIYIFF